MAARKILSLRRLPRAVTNPDDNVLLDSVNLRCAVCDHRWPASLGAFGDEVAADQAKCPSCTPTTPRSA